MIIPDNVTVYMNGRAYCTHVCSFYQNGERLSLSIDTNRFKGGAEVNRVEPPRNREITVVTQASGKSVNITYDPHDAEAVKAVEAWRKALFSAARWACEEPVTVRPGDTVTFTGQRRRDYQPTLDALKKASEPLRDYLRAHGDPHTSIVVTQDGATETQDERHVTFDGEKPAEAVKSEESVVPEIIANPGNYGVIGFWWENWADGRCFLRWRTEPGADAMKVACLTGNPYCGFQVEPSCDGAEDVAGNTRRLYAHSKAAAMREVERDIRSRIPDGGDVRRLTWIRVKEPPKVDLQELDRAIRALSGVVKDDQSGLRTYFDGVNMSYVLECLKQFREAAT